MSIPTKCHGEILLVVDRNKPPSLTNVLVHAKGGEVQADDPG